ncbi:MAG TPA: TATA-box-binding protein [Candidatus Lokiarchaeia archaeon]|nr:TATA-box-binding protein [Candidatus Lokiarchaeia archaeon]
MAKKRTAQPSSGAVTVDRAEIKAEWKVENVVATVSVTLGQGEKIDLNQIARKYPDCEYNPERFPGLVMRVVDPKATILIFSTGKMVVTGMREAAEAEAVVNNVVEKLKQVKIDIKNEPAITIQNIVASGDLHVSIDLNEASVIMENAMYEPEVFPGLIYRMQEPKTVFLIFSTGRIVCTGAKTKEIVGEAVEKLVDQVKELGLTLVKGENDSGDDDDFI